jgi:hypothetical protein
MLRMAIINEKPGVSVEKRDGDVLIQIKKHRWVGVYREVFRLDIVSGRRDAAEMLLAQRNRHHNLLDDNPSSD